MIEQLPPNPRLYLARPSDDDQKVYSLVKFEPEKADDYPRYDDLLTALTSELSLFQAMHSPRFFSGRFSRGAETFCFLKLENSDPAFRSRIENSLYDILAPTRAGCALSGGSGLRYSYIHVVLGDLAHAIPLLRAGLSSVGIPRRSWLMFFDADLSHEWIALHPDAPPPPEPVEV